MNGDYCCDTTMATFRVWAVAYGYQMARYDGYIQVWAFNEDEARAKGLQRLKSLGYNSCNAYKIEKVLD